MKEKHNYNNKTLAKINNSNKKKRLKDEMTFKDHHKLFCFV